MAIYYALVFRMHSNLGYGYAQSEADLTEDKETV